MKDKEIFKGWNEVFRFTFCQLIKEKGYVLTTSLVALALVVILVVTNYFMGKDAIREEKISSGDSQDTLIERVYVHNKSDVEKLDFSPVREADILFENVTFSDSDKEIDVELKDVAKKIEKGKEVGTVVLEVERLKDSYKMNLYLPKGTEVEKGDAEDLLSAAESVLQQNRMMNLGIDATVLAMASAPVDYQVTKAGEDSEDMVSKMLKMFLPMLCAFMLYFMILMNGQGVAKLLVSEKSSKLMELLLALASPYSLIFGKIVASILAALMQLGIWIVCGIGGFFAGNELVKSMAPDYENVILQVIDLIKDNASTDAFSPAAIVIGILAMIVGFSLYVVLAGMVTSKINRSEDLDQAMTLFVMIVLIGFFASYFVPMMQTEAGEFAAMIFRYIPFTAAYTLCADVILGNIGIGGAIVSLLISVATIIVLVIFAGKIYKNTLFYRGGKNKTKKVLTTTES